MIPLYNYPFFPKATGNVKNFCCIYIGIGLHIIMLLEVATGNGFQKPHPPFDFRISIKSFAFCLLFKRLSLGFSL